MSIFLRGLPLVLLLAAFPAAAEKIACPAEIKTATAQLAAPVAGWTARVDGMPTQLSAATFYDGTPEDGASLVPDGETHTKSKLTSTWKLGATGSHPYWLGCRYANTNLTLERQLPSGLKECTVSYNPTTTIDGLPEIKDIACK